MKNKLLMLVLIFLLLLVSVPSAWSYFFTYTKATGTITINLLEEKEGLRFSIANKANPTNLTLSEMVKRGKTSKKNGGLGLYSAKKMLDVYENAELKIDFSKQNHCFFVEMYLASRKSKSAY